jgi:hypothetical protein
MQETILKNGRQYRSHPVYSILTALQRQFRLYIPFLGIAWPQPKFSHSCVCERFIYSQDRSTYFLQRKGRPIVGIYNSHMNVEIGTEAPIFLFWEYFFQIFGILSLQYGPSFAVCSCNNRWGISTNKQKYFFCFLTHPCGATQP